MVNSDYVRSPMDLFIVIVLTLILFFVAFCAYCLASISPAPDNITQHIFKLARSVAFWSGLIIVLGAIYLILMMTGFAIMEW